MTLLPVTLVKWSLVHLQLGSYRFPLTRIRNRDQSLSGYPISLKGSKTKEGEDGNHRGFFVTDLSLVCTIGSSWLSQTFKGIGRCLYRDCPLVWLMWFTYCIYLRKHLKCHFLQIELNNYLLHMTQESIKVSLITGSVHPLITLSSPGGVSCQFCR